MIRTGDEIRAAGREDRARRDLERPRPHREELHTDYAVKWLKAVAKASDDLDMPLAFYGYPAEHSVHLKTTNLIESTFATARFRQWVTKGTGTRAAGIATAFKRIESAQRGGAL